MKILAIETSCDETAVAVLECAGNELTGARFRILGNALYSQIEKHRAFGGVFPALAKREHAKNLVPILESSLKEASLLEKQTQHISEDTWKEIALLLEREPELYDALATHGKTYDIPDIDAISVTHGPGLPPALWVGVNFAKALSILWNKPVVPVNHMEGHVLAALAKETDDRVYEIKPPTLPLLALLISGGHTELVLMRNWLSYELIGQTKDDAVGEAFDKVARMLSLPYPGGPEISKLAEAARAKARADLPFAPLPRPMLKDSSCDFSFSGLKTAVLYLLKAKPNLSDSEKESLAEEFENTVAEVLLKKTERAIETTGARMLVIGGGVAANKHIRREFEKELREKINLCIPEPALTTDNALMIGMAGYFRALKKEFTTEFKADGNLSISTS